MFIVYPKIYGIRTVGGVPSTQSETNYREPRELQPVEYWNLFDETLLVMCTVWKKPSWTQIVERALHLENYRVLKFGISIPPINIKQSSRKQLVLE